VRPGSVNSQPERVGSGSSINVGSPPSEHSRDISAELQIKQLQDMLHAQERQFQHQLQEQQLQQRQLQQQLQHQQIQQQLQQQQLLMGKQQQQSQMLRQAGMTQQGQQTAVRTTGLQGSGYAQMPSGQQAAGAQPIMVLGPNGQLMQLMPQANGGMAMSAQPAASSPMVSTQATAMSQSAAARKPPANAIGFTPIVNAAGQAMMAPPTSPLMTVGHSTPASLPPGSIGPHYIPAPGGGYQAVYMVPSGTLPPGTATNVPGGIAKSTVQKPQHAPMRYGGYPGLATTQPTAAPFVPTGNQEEDDFALAMRLQQEEDARSGGASAGAVPKPQQRVPAARPASAGPPDAYFQDSYLANASYIANDEELARQLAAADLSDEE
jgi:AraC-like DNA-binding protein